MKLYLDHNVYIECFKDKDLKDFIIAHCRDKNIQVLYGPAHIEETYRVEMQPDSPYASSASILREIIDEVTNSTDIMPSYTDLIIKHERTSKVYKRVKGFDTTEIVKNDSLTRLRVDSENYRRMREEDKHNEYISTLSAADIWEHPKVKEQIDFFNANSEDMVGQHNASLRVILISALGVDSRLPADFKITSGNYSTRLKHSFTELEYTIENLMRILNFCGYHAEKKERKAISSTHDTTHCIYATATDYLLAMDEKFTKKCEAVYHFFFRSGHAGEVLQ